MLALAETLVSAFCQALGFNGSKRSPRVDVFALAEDVGAELVVSEFDEDGQVIDTPHATRILLDEEPIEARRRFTLGHELGHLVLSDPKVFRLLRPQFQVEKLKVEQICNAFAAELLMPRKWTTRRYEGHPEEFDALLDLAENAEVSLAAGLTRLVTTLDWSCSLLYFQRNRDWAPVITAGRYRLKRVRIAGGTSDMLWKLHTSGKPEVRTLPLRIGGKTRPVACQMRPTETGFVGLANLSAAGRAR